MKTNTAVAEASPPRLPRDFQLNLIRELAKAAARRQHENEG